MGERLQTKLDEEMVKWLRRNVANSESMTDAELVRHWLGYARRQYQLESAKHGSKLTIAEFS